MYAPTDSNDYVDPKMSFPCPAFVGFIFLLGSFALGIASLASPGWLESEAAGNGTQTKGLWEVCGNGTCRFLDLGEQSAWFKSVQALHVIGCGGLLLAVIFSIAFIFCVKYRSSFGFCKTIITDLICSLISLTIAVIVMGVEVKTGRTLVDIKGTAFLSWTFYLAVANLPLLFLVIPMFMWEARRLKIIRSPYLDIRP